MSDHNELFDELADRSLKAAGRRLALKIELADAISRKSLAGAAREQGLDELAEVIDTQPQFALEAPKPRRGRPPGSKNRVNSANHVQGDRYFDDQIEAAVEAERNGHEE
jgi:hypothetical protein